MTKRRIVIVGGGVAGLAAAVSAREKDAEASIAILSKDPYQPYRKPSLPCIIRGTVSRAQEIMIGSQLLESKKICLQRGVEATNVNIDERIVKARDAKMKERAFSYDALILTTGGYSYRPAVKGADLKNVFTLDTLDDALNIAKIARKGKKAVIIGAGLVAFETAEALVKREVDVTMVVRSRILRRLIEPDFSSQIQKMVEKKGLRILVGAEVKQIVGSKSVEYVEVSIDRSFERIPASMVVFSTGIRASVKLAEEAGIKIGRSGGIHVDDYMQTSIPYIYAAGDCVETLDPVTKRLTYVPVGGIAAQSGTIAGVNASGENTKSQGFLRAQRDNLFGIEITSIGHGTVTAKELGIKVSVENMELPYTVGKRSYFAEKHPAKAKVIVDQKRRIMGAQVIGHKLTEQISYALFKAVEERMMVDEVKELWKLPLATMADFSMLSSSARLRQLHRSMAVTSLSKLLA